jgi:hypothetical protein
MSETFKAIAPQSVFQEVFMRIFHTSVITLCIVLLATATAAQTDAEKAARFLKNGTVAAPPIGEPKINPSKVKFLPRGKGTCSVGFSNGVEMDVVGIVDREIDLSDDPTAQQILLMGFAFGREQCPPHGENFQGVPRSRSVSVSLFPGDPATVTVDDVQKILKAHEYSSYSGPPPLDKVDGVWSTENPDLIYGYRNYPKALKEGRAYYAQEERKRTAALEQQRQAEQKIAARWAAFLKTNRVKQVVEIDQLTANPFVYKGQVVAISGFFERMNSPTQGIFLMRGYMFVVSGISTARFTQRGSAVVLAGRVLGNIEVKPGLTVVPHLSFVGLWVPD